MLMDLFLYFGLSYFVFICQFQNFVHCVADFEAHYLRKQKVHASLGVEAFAVHAHSIIIVYLDHALVTEEV